MQQPNLFDSAPEGERPPDEAARDFATNPVHDVVLEASAGTGKTSVLVKRYVRLIEQGVDPANVLAVTFTRKAAAEMRERILVALRQHAATDARFAARWEGLRERVGDIQISTIDAFCFALLREFPLEADVDPAFEIADETEMARFGREAVDLTLRTARDLMVRNETVRLLFTRVRLGPLRDALQSLLDRRHVALPAVATFVARRVRHGTAADAAAAFVDRLQRLFSGPDARTLFADGPAGASEFCALRDEVQQLGDEASRDPARVRQLERRLQRYFLTDAGRPRSQAAKRFVAAQFPTRDAKRRHDAAMKIVAPQVQVELEALAFDVQGLLARGLQTVLAIATGWYERLLDEHAVLDFAGMLVKAVTLLSRQEEFARSRLKLQARYHHVLVDEFQDTSRLQWQLVERLVDAWGEGEGVQGATSIFVVGDRKQSIYRFRHAEVTLLDEVARKLAALRPGRTVRQAITHSYRAVPELLAFVNAVSTALDSGAPLDGRFTYEDRDRFLVPEVGPGARRDGAPVLGLIAETSMEACARAVATEIARLLEGATVRDRTGSRAARPDDIAILFRARTGHQYFEAALEARGIRTYVYKGLGFFDSPEVQDLQALLRYLARPESDLRAAELLRSRFVRLSDPGLAILAPDFANALRGPDAGLAVAGLDPLDGRLLETVRDSLARWLALVDRVGPGELIDVILRESAYAFELRGPRLDQARENLKKMRGLVRRIENRGYATLGRIAEYFETLRAGDESHAVVEAAGCVNLMTVHASKGLEFPIVFVVNLHLPGRGRSSAFSVIERGPEGEPEVVFGSSDATRLEDAHEREELRRLFYVAMTRARDRLYLAAEVDPDQHAIRRGPRSLASLLPASLADVFASAASSPRETTEIDWEDGRGSFAFRVCRPSEGRIDAGPGASAATRGEPDVRQVQAVDRTVASAIDMAWETRSRLVTAAATGSAGDRLVGTLVHRLFQRQLDEELSESAIADVAGRLLRPDEGAETPNRAQLAESAAGLYRRLRSLPEVVKLLAPGRCYYEVPFSFHPADRPDVVVRGRIDCVVEQPNGELVILEFKTGRARAEHETQVAIYRDALAAVFPGRDIRVRTFYP